MAGFKRMNSVLAVKDLEITENFFIKKLGFKLEADNGSCSYLSRDGFGLILRYCPKEIPASEFGSNSYSLRIEVEEVDDLNDEFLIRGVNSITAPVNDPAGWRKFMVTTPDGHVIMFAENPFQNVFL